MLRLWLMQWRTVRLASYERDTLLRLRVVRFSRASSFTYQPRGRASYAHRGARAAVRERYHDVR